MNLILALGYAMLVKGDHTNFEIEPWFGAEASELYPDVKYTKIDKYCDVVLDNPWTDYFWGFLSDQLNNSSFFINK